MNHKTEQFYKKFYVENSNSNTPYPNLDEVHRLSAILKWMSMIAISIDQELTILDVGCGRGWLTNFLIIYGDATGIDPVDEVIDYARELFPHIGFENRTPKEHLTAGKQAKYDVVVCSEVIEHIPDSEKLVFLHDLISLTKPGGDIILTTPRGEIFDAYVNYSRGRNKLQPIEDWLTKKQLTELIHQANLVLVDLDEFRFLNLPFINLRSKIKYYSYLISRKLGLKPKYPQFPIYQAVHLKVPNN